MHHQWLFEVLELPKDIQKEAFKHAEKAMYDRDYFVKNNLPNTLIKPIQEDGGFGMCDDPFHDPPYEGPHGRPGMWAYHCPSCGWVSTVLVPAEKDKEEYQWPGVDHE